MSVTGQGTIVVVWVSNIKGGIRDSSAKRKGEGVLKRYCRAISNGIYNLWSRRKREIKTDISLVFSLDITASTSYFLSDLAVTPLPVNEARRPFPENLDCCSVSSVVVVQSFRRV